MNNIKKINKNNLLHNLELIKKYNKNVCVMVKADAYGNNLKTIVNELKYNVQWFGVANECEALQVKKVDKYCKVLIVGKIVDYYSIIKNNISFTIDSKNEIDNILSVCQKHCLKANVHIAINTGMNRIGVKDLNEFKCMLEIINQNIDKIKLEGIFTHCFDADCKDNHFYEQMVCFYKYVKLIKDKNIIIHIGGSYVLKHKIPDFVNMVRVGFYLYGYGKTRLKPAMKIESKIIKLIKAKAGEFVGYGNKTKLSADTKIAVVPIGYADGLPRVLSNKKYAMEINQQKAYILGNICMDMCMLDVTYIDCKVGDKVICFDNANTLAKIVNTSPYEILTNFQKLRGGVVVE